MESPISNNFDNKKSVLEFVGEITKLVLLLMTLFKYLSKTSPDLLGTFLCEQMFE